MTNTQARRWWNRQRIGKAAADLEAANVRAAAVILENARPDDRSLSVLWAREVIAKAKGETMQLDDAVEKKTLAQSSLQITADGLFVPPPTKAKPKRADPTATLEGAHRYLAQLKKKNLAAAEYYQRIDPETGHTHLTLVNIVLVYNQAGHFVHSHQPAPDERPVIQRHEVREETYPKMSIKRPKGGSRFSNGAR